MFICQIWFLGWNKLRFDINSKNFFSGSFLLFYCKDPKYTRNKHAREARLHEQQQPPDPTFASKFWLQNFYFYFYFYFFFRFFLFLQVFTFTLPFCFYYILLKFFFLHITIKLYIYPFIFYYTCMSDYILLHCRLPLKKHGYYFN